MWVNPIYYLIFNVLTFVIAILNTMLVLVDSEEHLLSFHFAIQRKKLREFQIFICVQ